jgi:putative FmdB family regulatory protein
VPTYQYSCTECQHQLETVQSFTDPALTECPECAGRLRKLYSGVGIVFKGSGFYRTDSRSGSGSSDPTTTADSAKAAEKTKPAEKGNPAESSSKPAESTKSADKSSTAKTPAAAGG